MFAKHFQVTKGKVQGKYPLARITTKLKDCLKKEKDLHVCLNLKTKDV